MAELTLAYKVNTNSSGTHGRAICNARTHHFIADDSGGEAVGAGELFLSGITACAVNMVERIAKNEAIPVEWMDVSAEAYRDPEAVPSDLTVFADVRVHFQIWGVDDDQGQHLVNTWKQR
ncbi:MAG: OsmC family protein [Dehalococcoidia bacterium]